MVVGGGGCLERADGSKLSAEIVWAQIVCFLVSLDSEVAFKGSGRPESS